jgi:NADPH:quinone reductase-like Zn-dependent oxidoreductase
MKAAQFKQYGHADEIAVVDVAKPAPAAGQVLVEVYAASLNPFDTAVREGYLQQMIPLELPVTIGADIAGVVTQLGDGVTRFAVGDKVYGAANVVSGNSGALAEYAAVKEDNIARMPKSIDYQQAAVLPIAGISAYQAITEGLKLAEGQKILILGGAGGIGTIGIQVAKHLGAYVATTAKEAGVELARSLGADLVIDSTKYNFVDKVHDYDAILDSVGTDEFTKAFAVLKPGGLAVSLAARGYEEAARSAGVSASSQMTVVTTARLDGLSALIEAGAVKPQVGHVYPLGSARQAFEARESSDVKGKIVVQIKD